MNMSGTQGAKSYLSLGIKTMVKQSSMKEGNKTIDHCTDIGSSMGKRIGLLVP